MENLAQAMTKLDQIKATTKVDLKLDVPKIVVLGAQSVGKSSVLERIVGEEFLPRGTGIVTRVPIVLTLHNTPKGDKEREKYGAKHTGTFAVFGEHGTAVELCDVRVGIEQRTKCRVGTTDVADKPIFLSIYSETVPNLSLVDLPGLTGQAANGQPADISQKIRKMALKYIEGENAIILAISEATSDIVNSESLKLAKRVDPECKRTIAVLTKLDMAWEHRPNMLLQEFAGKTLPIRLGIIGVMNGSDVQQSASTDESSQTRKPLSEEEFLAKHGLEQKHGIRVLSETLANQLQDHIRKCVPELERQVKKKKQAFREALDKLGQKYAGSKPELFSIVSEFTHVYEDRIRCGSSLGTESAVSAADIADIFHPQYTNELEKIVPLDGYSQEKLLKTYKQHIGLNPKDLPHPNLMIGLIRKSTKKMQEASERCADQVHAKLMELFESVFLRFPNIKQLFRKTLETMLNKQLEIAKQYIAVVISMQSSFINDRYPPYAERSTLIDGKNDKDESKDGDANKSPTDVLGASGQCKMNTVVKKVRAYFETSRDIVADNVKKLIVYHLIGHVEKNLSACLNHQVNEADRVVLFAERPEVEQKRQKLEQEIAAFEEADEAIRKVCGNSTASSTV